jgi:hypothetical protein
VVETLPVSSDVLDPAPGPGISKASIFLTTAALITRWTVFDT